MTLRGAGFLGVGIAGVAAIAVAIAIAVASEPMSSAPGRTTASSAATAATAESVAALQREVEALKKEVKRPHATVIPGPTQDSGAASASPDHDPAPHPVKAVEPAQITAMLEAHHASEPVDRASSDELNAGLSAALDAHRDGTTVSEARCAVSLCKVTLVHDSHDAQMQLAAKVAGLPALRAGVFYSYQDTEKPPRTVLYVVREGHDISEMIAAQ